MGITALQEHNARVSNFFMLPHFFLLCKLFISYNSYSYEMILKHFGQTGKAFSLKSHLNNGDLHCRLYYVATGNLHCTMLLGNMQVCEHTTLQLAS